MLKANFAWADQCMSVKPVLTEAIGLKTANTEIPLETACILSNQGKSNLPVAAAIFSV